MNLKMKYFILILFSSFLGIHSEFQCNDQATCGECIGFANDRCVWCSKLDMKEKRCKSSKEMNTTKLSQWCPSKFLVQPENAKTNITRNEDFHSSTPKMEAVQFKPQILNVKVHPGVPIEFDMSYKPAKDFPLDIYYLMDYSFTMRNHMKVLREQGTQLYKALTKFTNNVQFGVGSFVEKAALPYANPLNGITTSYSFRNRLPLTDNIEEFKTILSGERNESNYDDPEAGLDALMQVMICENDIKWRSDARKIIILCTDSTYHSAGDGKMVGAFMPNDMKCHLNATGSYVSELIYDYPSVSQINKASIDGNFMIIFAALDKVSKEYTALAGAIKGAQYAVLAEKSNIVNIIKDAYVESLRYMEIRLHSLPPNVELYLEPNCTKSDFCQVEHNKILTMKATLNVTSCEKISPLKIGPLRLKEHLTINIDVNCECDCEKRNIEKNSPRCSISGTLQCGICKCNPTSYGDECQCTGSSALIDLDKCKASINDTHYCSGRGTCKCGKCEKCLKGFSGQFCQFDDNACVRVNDELCAGKGRCHLGKCECKPHWTGNDCNCPDHDRDCIALYSKEVCSGGGKCICGKCTCTKYDSKNELYGGTFCEICEECAQKRCNELSEYVYCIYTNQTNCDNTNKIEVVMVNKTEMQLPKYAGEKCNKILENGTSIVFKHRYDNKLHIIIQKELDNPPKANIWVAVGSAVGVVLLIGLLTIIGWKILVDMHDKKEYERFATEAKAQGFVVSQNPWYIPPSHNFSNPTFEE